MVKQNWDMSPIILTQKMEFNKFRKRTIEVVIIITMLTFSYCKNSTKLSNKLEAENELLKKKWGQDTNGCFGLRNEALANRLLTLNDLMHGSKQSFLSVFKPANEILNEDKMEILIYYFDNVCEKGKPVLHSDKCYARFYFKSDRLVSTDFICE